MIDKIDEEVERIQFYQDNLRSMSDQRRLEVLEKCLEQYKALMLGNKAMLSKIRG
jgi:hypothetical protein